MLIDRATPEDIRAVALNMRDSDFAEFAALSWASSREELAEELVGRYGASGCILARAADGEPVAVGDVVEMRPRVGSLLFYATERFPEVAVPLTRFIVQRLFRQLREAGVHRIEAVSSSGYKHAHRWIECLGLSYEATFPCYGKSGETFIQFAWKKETESVQR